ncbi:MAG: hypothetical protein WCZ17_09260, partial [Candidatus Kapaibacterium sp.]
MKISLLILFILICQNSYSSDWKHIKQLNTGHVVNIDCWDSLNCYCLLQQTGFAELYLSSDGGKKWLMQYKTEYDNPQTKRFLNAKLCVSPHPDYFYISSWEGTLIKSTDGGKNFSSKQLSDKSILLHILMKDSITGLSVISSTKQVYLQTTKDAWETSFTLDSNIYRTNILMEEILE